MLTYATSSDLATWTSAAAPANATALLRAASLLVAEYTGNDWYTTDDDGHPTDAALIAAFRDATTEQAATWIALGIDPAGGAAAAARTPTMSTIGTARVEYSGVEITSQARVAAVTQLADSARRILNLAGVGSSRLVTW